MFPKPWFGKFRATPVTIFIDRFSPFAYNSQSRRTAESGIGGETRKGQQPCSLWATVGSTVTAASGGLKRWEKLSFRACISAARVGGRGVFLGIAVIARDRRNRRNREPSS